MYSAKIRPCGSRMRRSIASSSTTPSRFQRLSYRNVGWNSVSAGNPAGKFGEAGEISSPHGSVVGLPNSSWLNQFPHRPTAWASRSPGATQSANTASDNPFLRETNHAATAPNSTAPMMPSPPSQIRKTARGSAPGPKYPAGSVISTW